MINNKTTLQELLSLADIKINGNNSWDIKVNNEKFYKRVLSQGSLGLGESYMDGWRDCERLDEFFFHIFQAKLEYKIKKNGSYAIYGFKIK